MTLTVCCEDGDIWGRPKAPAVYRPGSLRNSVIDEESSALDAPLLQEHPKFVRDGLRYRVHYNAFDKHSKIDAHTQNCGEWVESLVSRVSLPNKRSEFTFIAVRQIFRYDVIKMFPSGVKSRSKST